MRAFKNWWDFFAHSHTSDCVRSQSTKKLLSDFTHKANEPSISHLESTSYFFNVIERLYIYPIMYNLSRFVLLLKYYNKTMILKFLLQKSK